MRSAVKCYFSFVEVSLAVLLLAISVAVLSGVSAQARRRHLNAERIWANEHNLSNAAEFFLLEGPGASVPTGLLPQGFRAECQIEAPEGVAGDVVMLNWELRTYVVRVWNARGELTGERRVDKPFAR